MSKRDYYEVLGVERGADAAAIKSAYRRMAMKYHPDRNTDDPTAEGKFKEVQAAYACLSDEQKRAMYDRFGHEGLEAAAGGGGGFGAGAGFSSVFEDVFSDFFGGGRRQSRRQQRVLDINLTFDEMANGCEKEIRITLPATCDACAGSGAAPGASSKTCAACDGQGQVRMQRGVFTVQQACSKCGGNGRVIERPCGECAGAGKVNRARHLQVNIPAGVDGDSLIRVNVEDGGDDELFIRANVRRHPLFQRDGDNLHMEVPISIVTAALGGDVTTPSVKGGKLQVKIPAGVQGGQVLRVAGAGLPNVRSGRRGNLMCHITVEVPVDLNAEQRKLLRAFDKSLQGGKGSHTPKSESWLDKITQFFTE